MTRAPVTDARGEPVQRVRDPQGNVKAIRVGGGGYVTEAALEAQVQARYLRPEAEP